jgi:hypothetical protein
MIATDDVKLTTAHASAHALNKKLSAKTLPF